MTDPAPLRMWTVEPPPPEVRAALLRLQRLPDVARVAVMPDVHLSREVCVGVVLATRRSLVPAAVGGDIGCGMAAIAFDANADVLDRESTAMALLEDLRRGVPILRQRGKQSLPASLTDSGLGHQTLEKARDRDGQLQLGTLGRGNHFVELQADDDNRLWLMVHSGSRSMGQLIRAHHERSGVRQTGGIRTIDGESPQGIAYLSDLQWALRYAGENRMRIVETVVDLVATRLGVRHEEASLISCNHNFVRQEDHSERLWVHRKGSISALLGEAGIVPGSMGTNSYHVAGRGHPDALMSCSHGAGRLLSRTEARRAIGERRLVDQMSGVWFAAGRARQLVDEAPSAYRDIEKVMRVQRDLTRIVRRLEPRLSFKG